MIVYCTHFSVHCSFSYHVLSSLLIFFFFFIDTPPTEIYPLSLHDALPISLRAAIWPGHVGPSLARDSAQQRPDRAQRRLSPSGDRDRSQDRQDRLAIRGQRPPRADRRIDRKSTRLNSSHQIISYAVFCLKK